MCCTTPAVDDTKQTECVSPPSRPTAAVTSGSDNQGSKVKTEIPLRLADIYESLEDLKPITEMGSFEQSISPFKQS